MRNRWRVLVYLIQRLSVKKKYSKSLANKILFLLTKEYHYGERISFYSFFPHNYGPFSNEFYRDLGELKRDGFIDENTNLTKKGKDFANILSYEFQAPVDKLVDKFNYNSIREYVYSKYPEYAQRSKLISNKKRKFKPGIFTIGYEKENIDSFLDKLIQNHIDVLVDVRYNPFSMNFVFTDKILTGYLNRADINYIHIPELGIPGENRKKLYSQKDYDELFVYYRRNILTRNKQSIDKLYNLGNKKRIALMCFEKNIEQCHRGVLAKKLNRMGNEVVHI